MSVLTRPKGDSLAKAHGPYFSVREIDNIKNGDLLDILCTDGLNYHVKVEEIHVKGWAHLHFPYWPKKNDYKGPLQDLYIAAVGKYSHGISSQNSYHQISKPNDDQKSPVLNSKASKAAAGGSKPKQSLTTKYPEDYLSKPRLSYKRPKADNDSTLGNISGLTMENESKRCNMRISILNSSTDQENVSFTVDSKSVRDDDKKSPDDVIDSSEQHTNIENAIFVYEHINEIDMKIEAGVDQPSLDTLDSITSTDSQRNGNGTFIASPTLIRIDEAFPSQITLCDLHQSSGTVKTETAAFEFNQPASCVVLTSSSQSGINSIDHDNATIVQSLPFPASNSMDLTSAPHHSQSSSEVLSDIAPNHVQLFLDTLNVEASRNATREALDLLCAHPQV